MKTFWRVLETLAVVTLVLVWPLGAFAQIGKITSPGGSGATPQTVFDSTACTSAVGTDAYACSPATSPCPAALANGQYVFLTTDVANTGAATFAYCGLAAKAIVWPSPTASVALATGDMLANVGYLLQYNATGDNWKLGFSSNTPSVAANNTWTGTQTINTAPILANDVGIYGVAVNGANNSLHPSRSALTPDSGALIVGTNSTSWHMFENADGTFDFNNGRCGTSTCTDPSFIIHSHNQSTTEYVQTSNDGTLSHLDGQAGTNGVGQFAWAGAKTLTESSPTVVVDVPVASGAYTGATINWTVVASDATDHQSRRGATYLAVVNKAGTETCTVGDIGTPVVAVSTGTLTVTTAADVTGTNVCTLTINAVSSLTQTVLRAYYSVQVDGPGIPLAR